MSLVATDAWGESLRYRVTVLFLGQKPLTVIAGYLIPPPRGEIERRAWEVWGMQLELAPWLRSVDARGWPRARWVAPVLHHARRGERGAHV